MIKLENVILASSEQMLFIIEGMRNPMNSWKKSDSYAGCNGTKCRHCDPMKYDACCRANLDYEIGNNDLGLMKRLSKAGTDHRKFMRMMPVYVRITAPLYWWKEFDTYKVGTVANSCSTMHKIQEKEFTLEDFSCKHLDLLNVKPSYDINFVSSLKEILRCLNLARDKYLETKDKKYWWQMIQLLPSSYNQTRNVMMNYEALSNIYKSRKTHKLDEWRKFCKWIESLPYSELITHTEQLTGDNEDESKS